MSSTRLVTTPKGSRRQFVTGVLAASALALGGRTVRSALARSGGGFGIGDRVIVNTDLLNLRDGPGLGYAVQDTLDYGTYLSIQDGPVFADDHSWFQVYSDPDGWVAGEFLLYVATPFQIGDAVVVDTDALNLRRGQGLEFDVIDVLPYGTNATVIGIPASGSGDGHIWLRIETSDGRVGWVAGEYLALA